MMGRLGKLMEWFWLVVAIVTLVNAIQVISEVGLKEGAMWLLFPAIALAMFIFRRMTTKRLARMEEERKRTESGS